MEGAVALVVEAARAGFGVVGGDVSLVDQDGGRAVAPCVVGERGIIAAPLGPMQTLAALADGLAKALARVVDVWAVGVVDELDFGGWGWHCRLG